MDPIHGHIPALWTFPFQPLPSPQSPEKTWNILIIIPFPSPSLNSIPHFHKQSKSQLPHWSEQTTACTSIITELFPIISIPSFKGEGKSRTEEKDPQGHLSPGLISLFSILTPVKPLKIIFKSALLSKR